MGIYSEMVGLNFPQLPMLPTVRAVAKAMERR
jgi:hypothetical protein